MPSGINVHYNIPHEVSPLQSLYIDNLFMPPKEDGTCNVVGSRVYSKTDLTTIA